jgi:hypothetical protein
MFLCSLILQWPAFVELPNQFGQVRRFPLRPEVTQQWLYAFDAKGVRTLANWVRASLQEGKEVSHYVIVLDISQMPERIKEKRFLPQIQSQSQELFLVNGSNEMAWVPTKSRCITHLVLSSHQDPVFDWLEDLSELSKRDPKP